MQLTGQKGKKTKGKQKGLIRGPHVGNENVVESTWGEAMALLNAKNRYSTNDKSVATNDTVGKSRENGD